MMTSIYEIVVTNIIRIGFDRLITRIDEYMRRRKAVDYVFNVLKDDFEKYLNLSEEMSKLVKEEALPKLQSIKVRVTTEQFNSIVMTFVKMIDVYSELIRTFIGLAKNCSYISKNEGFMDDLKKSDILIYDFINQMRDIYVEPNHVRISGSFYVFIKLYEREFGRAVQKDELEKAVKEAKSYVENFKRAMKKPPRAGKKLLKKLEESYRRLQEVCKNVEVQPADIDLKVYIPSDLLPIVTLLEGY
jgi:hypothetical protein